MTGRGDEAGVVSLFSVQGGGNNSEMQSQPRSPLPNSGVPQSRTLNKQMGGRVGRVPAGRTATPKPGRKRERERDVGIVQRSTDYD